MLAPERGRRHGVSEDVDRVLGSLPGGELRHFFAPAALAAAGASHELTPKITPVRAAEIPRWTRVVISNLET